MTEPTIKKVKKFSSGGLSAHMILLVCMLLYMINYMDRQVLSAVQEVMKTDLGLSDTQTGIIQTVFLLSIALCSLPIAFAADRWSRRKALGFMALLWSGFTFLTGLGRSFLGVLFPRMIVGVGEAGFAAVGTAMITGAYPESVRGRVLGIFNLAIPVGSAIGVVLGGYLSVHFGGWRTPFYVFAIPGILLGIIAFFLGDYRTVPDLDEQGRRKNFFTAALALFKIPTLKWLYIGYGMMQIMVFSFLVWGPAFIMRAHGVREDKAGLLIGLIGIMAIVGALLGGFLADWWQKRNPRGRMILAASAISLASVFLILGFILEFKGLGLAMGILFGVFAVMSVPALGAVTQDVVSPAQKSSVWGMAILAQYVLGGGWGPVIVGAISDHLGGGAAGLKVALIISSCGGLVAGLFYWLSSRHYAPDAERMKGILLESEK